MIGRPSWDNRVGRAVATYGYDAGSRGNGYLVPVIAKTDFTLDPRAAQGIPLAVGIDSSMWVSGALVVRVHARQNPWNGSTAFVVVENIMLVPEDPDVVFASTAAAVATTTDLGVAAVGSLLVVAFTGAIGPMLRVRLTTAGTSTAANALSIGVDLIGRPA